jgi:hypothetical protein
VVTWIHNTWLYVISLAIGLWDKGCSVALPELYGAKLPEPPVINTLLLVLAIQVDVDVILLNARLKLTNYLLN